MQRKVLTPNDFTDLDQIRDRLAAFEARYNAIARPFDWKFTRADLSDLLRRIDAHDKTKTHAWQPTALKFPGLWGLVSDFLMAGHGLDAYWARRGDGFRGCLK